MQSLRSLAASTSRVVLPSSRRSFCSCRPLLIKLPRSARSNPPTPKEPVLQKGKAVRQDAPSSELFQQLAKVPAVRNRPSLVNEDAARDLVRQWGVDKMEDVVVVDTWAGALLSSPFFPTKQAEVDFWF
jgi:hypothetical protein